MEIADILCYNVSVEVCAGTRKRRRRKEPEMLFKNITILDENFEIKENMYVGTVGSRITYIGSNLPQDTAADRAEAVAGEAKDYGEAYDGRGKLLMPAFYNAHGHSPMALMPTRFRTSSPTR